MTPGTLDAVRALVRTAAAKRPGEKQPAAFERAAALLNVSTATVANIFHGEIDACSEEKARQILALRRAVLENRLQHEIEQVEQHQAETRRILDEINQQGQRAWPTTSEIGSRGARSASRSGSATSLAASAVVSEAFLFWGVAT